jgi:hypothetical protein
MLTRWQSQNACMRTLGEQYLDASTVTEGNSPGIASGVCDIDDTL